MGLVNSPQTSHRLWASQSVKMTLWWPTWKWTWWPIWWPIWRWTWLIAANNATIRWESLSWGWLIRPKHFRPCASSKLCEFITRVKRWMTELLKSVKFGPKKSATKGLFERGGGGQIAIWAMPIWIWIFLNLASRSFCDQEHYILLIKKIFVYLVPKAISGPFKM